MSMSMSAKQKKENEVAAAVAEKAISAAAEPTIGNTVPAVQGEAGLPSTDVAPEGAWEAPEQLSSHEILLPKLHLMQGMSKLVGAEKALMGDIVNSITAQKFGGKGKVVEIIPLMKLSSTWIVSDVVYAADGKAEKKYKETVPVTAQNETLPWKESDKAGKVVLERDYTINFFVLMPGDIAGLPYMLSMRRTSLKAGKKIVNHFQKCQMDKCAPARYALKIDSEKMMKGDAAYYVLEVLADPRKTTADEYNLAYKWHTTLKTQKERIRVDESDLEENDNSAPEASPSASTVMNEQSQY